MVYEVFRRSPPHKIMPMIICMREVPTCFELLSSLHFPLARSSKHTQTALSSNQRTPMKSDPITNELKQSTMSLLLLSLIVQWLSLQASAGSWCIARSGAAQAAIQTAIDYACGRGGDCSPIQPAGLCYLPNTLQAHASYAFNSYYQRSNYAPGSCDFAGTATITISDPSYGSCTYPSSPSSAGGLLTPTGGTAPTFSTPTTSSPTFPTNGALPQGFGPSTTSTSGTGCQPPIHLITLFPLSAALVFYHLFLI